MGFSINDEVVVISGDYAGYYGKVVELGDGVVRVTHRDDYAGFWINVADVELHAE